MVAPSKPALEITWDDPESGRGLRLHGHIAAGITVRETREGDFSFYKALLEEPRIFTMMDRGQPFPSKQIETHFEEQLAKFSEGIQGAMILVQEEKPIGIIHLCPIERPGVGEISRALHPRVHGKGVGKAALRFLVNEWAPVVRARGLASENTPGNPTLEKFKCFGGETLALLYTTARPINSASWQSYKHFNLHPSPCDHSYQISIEGWESSQHGSLEEYIISRHFSGNASTSDPLEVDVRYAMRNETGALRTLSYVTDYDALRYHFERPVT